MNSFKMIWMRLNSIRFIDLKMKLNFNKIKMLRLCNDLSLVMNHRKDLKYCIINMKVDKVYRAIDDTIKKKNIFWIKFDWNFVETVRNWILYWQFWKRIRTRRCCLIVFFKNVHVRETNKSLFYCLSHAYNFAIWNFFSRIVFYFIFLYDMMNID